MKENKKPTVISVGYGRHLFENDSPDRLRMEACAKETAQFHMVIFVRKDDNLKTVSSESGLILHPVTANFSVFKLWNAFLKVHSLIKNTPEPVIVTSQDCFETGLIGWLATRFNKAKFNVQEHGDVFSTNCWKSENILNFFRFYLGLFILRRADSVRVVAKRISKTLIKKGVSENKIKQLSVITDPSVFVDASSVPEVSNLFSEDSFVFLTVARFVPQKNLKLLLKSFYKAQQKAPSIRLLLVGTGEELADIENIIKSEELNKDVNLVKVLPWTNDVPGFMKSVDSYVLSSNYEGWARVLLEAKYARLPIVTTDVGCAGEEVFDKTHGLVVPVNDEKLLVEALVSMATNKSQYEKYKQKMLSEDIPQEMTYSSYAKTWITTLE